MKDEIKELKDEFERIKSVGWIREKSKGLGSCGITFETMLKKVEDNFPVPDFSGIEIKTINNHSKYNIHLFNLTPDGDYLFPIKRILYELGYPSKADKNYKSFYESFRCSDYTKIPFGKMGKLHVNYKKRKIELLVINSRNENIDIGISWSFNYLRERLELKLQYLALVRASSRIINGNGYYYYNKINFFKLKDFNTFIKLIDMGIIEVTFKIGVYKSGLKLGQVYNHGTDFGIKVDDLELLYNNIDK